MKKIDEGVELFDEIWEKVYSAETQNQKEKYEVDLKKEIKKLQRLRDQVKTWIGGTEVKDKDNLLDARKLIETKMEQFKICEKETKTKTYSKEGLARAEKLSPEEQAKEDTCKWVGETIESLKELVEENDVEIEKLSSGKGKKSNKHQIEELKEFMQSHRFHINKLEGIMRLVMNDVLSHELVDDLKEDLEYYVESHSDEEYMQSYDEEYFYESLGLEDIGVVNVDRVTQVSSTKSSSSKDDASSSTSTSKEKKSKKKTSSNSVIPLTIGRAKVRKDDKDKDKDNEKDSGTPTKRANNSAAPLGPTPTTPVARPPPPVNANGGASMAAILKREGEQEKERQKQAALQQAQQQVRLIMLFQFCLAETSKERYNLIVCPYLFPPHSGCYKSNRPVNKRRYKDNRCKDSKSNYKGNKRKFGSSKQQHNKKVNRRQCRDSSNSSRLSNKGSNRRPRY